MKSAARVPPGAALAAWVVAGVVLAGCGTAPASGVPGESIAVPDKGTAVPSDAARILASVSSARLPYRLADGRLAVLVLGPVQLSGLGETCRIGRVSAADVGAGRPTAYAFCRRGEQWYEMTPVVVSGY